MGNWICNKNAVADILLAKKIKVNGHEYWYLAFVFSLTQLYDFFYLCNMIMVVGDPAASAFWGDTWEQIDFIANVWHDVYMKYLAQK